MEINNMGEGIRYYTVDFELTYGRLFSVISVSEIITEIN